MKITAIRRPSSLVEGVCERLSEIIRNTPEEEDFWLPPERVLAEKLGVSRTVVREATKRLEQRGMLDVQHGTGTKVIRKFHQPLSDSLSMLISDVPERLRQLNEVRLAIEPEAARLAALRATDEQLKIIEAAHQRLLDAQDGQDAIEADLAWHRAVVQASGNQILRLILDSLGDLGMESRLRTIGRIGKTPALHQHGQVLEALLRRDATAAADAMKNHILAAGRDMQLESAQNPVRKKPKPTASEKTASRPAAS